MIVWTSSNIWAEPDITPAFSPSGDNLAQLLPVVQLKEVQEGGGCLLYCKRDCKSVSGNTKCFSFSPLKPDAMNSEQTPPRPRDCEILVPFRFYLSISLTSFFCYNLMFPIISQMWAGPSHFMFQLFLFGSMNLGKWNRRLLLSKAPHLSFLSYFFYRAEFSLSKCL